MWFFLLVLDVIKNRKYSPSRETVSIICFSFKKVIREIMKNYSPSSPSWSHVQLRKSAEEETGETTNLHIPQPSSTVELYGFCCQSNRINCVYEGLGTHQSNLFPHLEIISPHPRKQNKYHCFPNSRKSIGSLHHFVTGFVNEQCIHCCLFKLDNLE